jgi:hypothetical protein
MMGSVVQPLIGAGDAADLDDPESSAQNDIRCSTS